MSNHEKPDPMRRAMVPLISHATKSYPVAEQLGGPYRHRAKPKRDREPAVIRFTVPTLTEAVLEDAEGFEQILRAIGDLDRALFLFGAAKEIDRCG